jgi:homoserine kinase
MIVRVPASSANLGPGFDTLGVALTMWAELGLVDPDEAMDDGGLPDGARRCDRHHPASVAFARCGGTGEVWERCSIPAGRGLGFSGAVRVGGGILAQAQRHGAGGVDDTHRAEVLSVVSQLEGHADNVAASLYGGVVATADGQVVRVPLALDPAVVVWIPSFVTKTDESRRSLGGPVPFADAVFNVGRVAMLVGALAAGDVGSLRLAMQDRLHQPARLAAAEPCRAAIDAALAAGAWCSWLSGSGPTVAAMCSVADADELAAAMPDDGRVKVLRIDHEGATIEAPYT